MSNWGNVESASAQVMTMAEYLQRYNSQMCTLEAGFRREVAEICGQVTVRQARVAPTRLEIHPSSCLKQLEVESLLNIPITGSVNYEVLHQGRFNLVKMPQLKNPQRTLISIEEDGKVYLGSQNNENNQVIQEMRQRLSVLAAAKAGRAMGANKLEIARIKDSGMWMMQLDLPEDDGKTVEEIAQNINFLDVNEEQLDALFSRVKIVNKINDFDDGDPKGGGPGANHNRITVMINRDGSIRWTDVRDSEGREKNSIIFTAGMAMAFGNGDINCRTYQEMQNKLPQNLLENPVTNWLNQEEEVQERVQIRLRRG